MSAISRRARPRRPHLAAVFETDWTCEARRGERSVGRPTSRLEAHYTSSLLLVLRNEQAHILTFMRI